MSYTVFYRQEMQGYIEQNTDLADRANTRKSYPCMFS
jgi:hypothetical protein